MIWKGTKCFSKKQLHEIQEYINSQLTKRYKKIEVVSDRTCFLLESGGIFSITCMYGKNFYDLCIEYADNEEDMRKYFTTDGGLYPLDKFQTTEELLQAMIDEIENSLD